VQYGGLLTLLGPGRGLFLPACHNSRFEFDIKEVKNHALNKRYCIFFNLVLNNWHNHLCI